MREHYIEGKVVDLFHVKHQQDSVRRMELENRVAQIINYMHSEIKLANMEAERKLLRKLEMIVRETL